jgi:hypothetical protein
MSTETFQEYRSVLRQIGSKYGIQRVENAMNALQLTSKYFPHPSEINESIQERIAIEQAEEIPRRQAEHAQWKQEQEARQHEKIMAEGGYCSMADVVGDYYRLKAAKAEAAEKARLEAKAAGQ